MQKNREPDDTDLQEETRAPLQTHEFVVQKGKTPKAANDSPKDDEIDEGDEG